MALLSRHERQQMRQRGAGTRKVNSIEFGLSFNPTPARRSARKTPSTVKSSARRPSNTPSRTVGQPSAGRSVRGASATSSGSVNLPRPRQSSALQRRRISGPASVQIREDREDDRQPKVGEQNNVGGAQQPTPELSENNDDVEVDKENEIPTEQDRGIEAAAGEVVGEKQRKRPKKRRSIGQQSLRRKKRTSTESAQEAIPELRINQVSTPMPLQNSEANVGVVDDSLILANAGSPESPVLDHDQAESKKRKKRKLVNLPPKKRKRASDVSLEEESGMEQATEELGEEDEPVQVPSPKRRNIPSPGRNSIRPIDLPPPTSPLQQDSEASDEDDTYIPEPEAPTPHVLKNQRRRAPASKRPSNNSAPSSRSLKSNTRPKSTTYPIITHRLTNPSALPTITESPDSGSDTNTSPEPTSSLHALSQPPSKTPNAIDVLAQIVTETLSNTLSAATTTSKSRTALQSLSATFSSQLLTHSAALTHLHSLESRVRRVRREKSDLQGRWAGVRRERAEVGVKCDKVRARHWAEEERWREMWELSERAWAVEKGVAERDKVESGEGELEVLARTVAERVSGGEGEGGLLGRVQEMNRMLEATLTGLESRR